MLTLFSNHCDCFVQCTAPQQNRSAHQHFHKILIFSKHHIHFALNLMFVNQTCKKFIFSLSLLPQIMILTGYTFIISVLTYYTFYRYIVQQDDYFKDFAWMHIEVQIFYLISILVVIYNANRMIIEVNEWTTYQVEILTTHSMPKFHFFLMQGKRTAHIAYDRINCCNDADVSFSVRKRL